MFERLPSLLPLHFFDLSFEAAYLKEGSRLSKAHILPTTGSYLEEDEAKVFFGWNEKGVYLRFTVFEEPKDVFYPEFRKGDSIELFFDTRNIKSLGYVTKFCHHFVLFPLKVDGYHIKEVTRFRNDDAHFLADPKYFQVDAAVEKKSYTIDLFIPSSSLHGYDISKFNKLGFTYRINRLAKEPCHFSVSSKEFVIERHPFFWSSLLLKTS